jgi:hypothetical protein
LGFFFLVCIIKFKSAIRFVICCVIFRFRGLVGRNVNIRIKVALGFVIAGFLELTDEKTALAGFDGSPASVRSVGCVLASGLSIVAFENLFLLFVRFLRIKDNNWRLLTPLCLQDLPAVHECLFPPGEVNVRPAWSETSYTFYQIV